MTDNPEQHAIELLQQISQQKQHALKSFYELFETRVYHYAFSRLNDPFDTTDTLNEVVTKAWLGRLRRTKSLKQTNIPATDRAI